MIPFAVLNSFVSDVKKDHLRVNSVMILVVLSTHAELASATLRGRSYCEMGELFSAYMYHMRLAPFCHVGPIITGLKFDKIKYM